MSLEIMHSAQAKSVGGRDGHITSDDHVLTLELTMPRTLGGRAREGATNPEQLFAAGYAACFGNAVIHAARLEKLHVGTVSVDAVVELGREGEGLPTLAVTLHVNLLGLAQAQAEELVAKAHQGCPYSRATRGNIDVTLVTTTDAA